MKMPRRDFIKAMPVTAYALSQTAKGLARELPAETTAAKLLIEPFDYDGVCLRESRWQKQYQAARDFWLGLPEDNILCGYRSAAGLPAPGKPLGGWCRANSNTVLGQWCRVKGGRQAGRLGGGVEREWHSGDRVEIRIPLTLRMQAVDKQHPDRVAVVRGPVVLVFETAYHDPFFRLPAGDEELNKWFVPDDTQDAQPGFFVAKLPDGKPVRSKFRPFYTVEEAYPYKMYFDKGALPIAFW